MAYKISLISLGCAKNLVDSEEMLAILASRNCELTVDESEADVILVNTCGFIASAKAESIDVIISCVTQKQATGCLLIVTGCLVKRYEAELKKEIPEVDLWLDTFNFHSLGEELDKLLPKIGKIKNVPRRIVTTASHWAYLKIAEGCSNKCAFCAIPAIRGPYVSRTIEDVCAEAQYLVSQGVQEIILLAQDTSDYGLDLYGKPALLDLLKALVKIDIFRIRILYSYGFHITDELLEFMDNNEKICPYLDIPMQHGSDKVLKAMYRPERRQELLTLIKKIRSLKRKFTIRSSFIVGFPGETEEDFQELLDFLEEARLDWVGVFRYSREEGTAAYDYPNQVPDDVKDERYHRTMALLSRLSAYNMESFVGEVCDVFVEGESGDTKTPYYGRGPWQAPESDGVIYLAADKDLKIGSKVQVKITAADIYDLVGEVI